MTGTDTPRRVYLIEDDETIVVLLGRVLQADGRFTVVGSASSMGHAAPEVERAQPDVVLVDNGLPDALGGPAARMLRALAPAAAVVVLSGSRAPEDHRELGVDRWVVKQDLMTVPHVLAEVLAERGA